VIAILPVEGLPEIEPGADLGALIVAHAELEDGDVVVVAQKAVSKAEGRLVRLEDVQASERAREIAGSWCDPRESEVILSETSRIVRRRNSLVIAETAHGFVCASAGVDHSNAPEPGTLVLLPVDPDESARAIRDSIAAATGNRVAVLVTDSFGRPFRRGTTDVAIGAAGIEPLLDLRGTADRAGRSLRSTQIAFADEVAAAADLVRTGKADGLPVVIVRGVSYEPGEGSGLDLLMPPDRDLFREQ
jgi:coenzyme F420-0:L-glutamate ligase/coenzyme F420-1:gamma-L-glutamate ligase